MAPTQPDGEHLSVDELVAYLGRLDSRSVREEMERHLLQCAKCRARVIATARALADTEPRSGPDPGSAPPAGWH